MNLLTVKVAETSLAAEEILCLELVRPDGRALPAFTPGAHIDVHLPGGLIRQYSLCNSATETHRYRVAILKDAASRGGSVAAHEQIRPGDLLQISEPRNRFELVPATRTILLAGGIGVTPLYCMAQALSASGADFELHYCTRSRSRTAFHDEIMASAFANKVYFHFDDGEPEQKLDLAALISHPLEDTQVYVCGPTGFIDFVIKFAKDAGWRSESLHLEYFGAEADDTPDGGPFQVKIASTGEVFTINPGEVITQVLESQGVYIPVSCEEGVCGTCLTGVLEGVPDHRDLYLTDEERAKNDQFTPCCSRSKSPILVLDL